MIRELKKCLEWPIEKINGVKPGVTVVTMPKGLSVNKLQKLAPQLFSYLDDQFLSQYGDIEVSEAYEIIITDNVMEETRGKDPKTQVREIEKYGGERPKVVEAITLLVLTFLASSEKRLFGKKPQWTFTRCEEQITVDQDVRQMVVGRFAANGFSVFYNLYDNDFYGLAARRKC